ncbi:MAG: MBL fold metallo-hydrolase [Gammaproteobacteria bacterium]|nr:MBL fold metallo-hydrolase [Gammaproteobacteria bacterium]
MTFTILGSGTPAPSIVRQSSGYVLEVGKDLIVFDHGGGSHQRLLEAGYKASDVTHLFLSHYHYDHTLDVPRLILTRWDHGAPDLQPLKIYGPSPLKQFLDGFFSDAGSFAMDVHARCASPASQAVYKVRGGQGERPGPSILPQEVVVGDVIEGEQWKITLGPTRHVQPTLNCLSFKIETEEGIIVYSGDNGGVFEPFIDFAKGADVLIHMNHFLSGTELNHDYRIMSGSHLDNAETAKQAGVNTLVLTHLQPDLDKVGVKERMVSEMAEIYRGNIIVGADLMQIPMVPAKPFTAD